MFGIVYNNHTKIKDFPSFYKCSFLKITLPSLEKKRLIFGNNLIYLIDFVDFSNFEVHILTYSKGISTNFASNTMINYKKEDGLIYYNDDAETKPQVICLKNKKIETNCCRIF